MLSIFSPVDRSNEISKQETAYLQRPISLARIHAFLLAVYHGSLLVPAGLVTESITIECLQNPRCCFFHSRPQ
jgi:hypothetical protein